MTTTLARGGRRLAMMTAAVSLALGIFAPAARACEFGWFEFTTPQNTALVVGAADGLLVHAGSAHVVTSVEDPRNGTVEWTPDGAFTYTPDPGFAGSDGFMFWASGEGRTGDGIVQVTVVEPNQPPIATDDEALAYLGLPQVIDVLGNDIDSGGNLSIASVTQGEHGTVSVVSGSDGDKADRAGAGGAVRPAFEEVDRILYTPEAGFLGTDIFTYVVTDGEFEATGTVTVNVGLDTTDPEVGAPWVDLKDTPSDEFVFVRVGWKGHDAESGIGSYLLQSTGDGSTWVDRYAGDGPKAKLKLTRAEAAAGLSFRVTATDRAGNATTGAITDWELRVSEEESAAVGHSRGWWSVPTGRSNGDDHLVTARKGAWVSFMVRRTVRQLAIMAPTSPRFGSVRVYLDGRHVATVSLRGKTAASHIVKVLRVPASSHARVLRLVAAGGRPTPFDAFVVLSGAMVK